MSELDDIAKAVERRGRGQTQTLEDFARSTEPPAPVPYARAAPRQRTGRLARYRRWCGLRSFICQVIVIVWTLLVGGLFLNSAANAWRGDLTMQNLANGNPPVGSPVYQMLMDQRETGISLSAYFFGFLWTLIGVPFGITAVVLLEQKSG